MSVKIWSKEEMDLALRSYSEKTADELRRDIETREGMRIEQIRANAFSVFCLVRMGEELPRQVAPFKKELLAIACNEMLPEVFYECAQNLTAMNAVKLLPLDVQARLIGGEGVEVAEKTSDGKWTHRKKLVWDLKPEEVRQVFERKHIRTVEQQRVYLQKQGEVSAHLPARQTGVVFLPDRVKFPKGYEATEEELTTLLKLLKSKKSKAS